MKPEKQIKRGIPGKKPISIKPGDEFIIVPNDFLRVAGVGKFYNRSSYPVHMQFTAEDEQE